MPTSQNSLCRRTGFVLLVAGMLSSVLPGCSREEEAEELAEAVEAPPAMPFPAGAGAPGLPGPGAGAPGFPGAGAGAGIPGAPGFAGPGAGALPGVPGAGNLPGMPPLPGPMADRNWILEREKETIATHDKDGDGMLSEEEYLQHYMERHRSRFEMLDFDKDGKLSAEEMADAMDPRKMMERAQQMKALSTAPPSPESSAP